MRSWKNVIVILHSFSWPTLKCVLSTLCICPYWRILHLPKFVKSKGRYCQQGKKAKGGKARKRFLSSHEKMHVHFSLLLKKIQTSCISSFPKAKEDIFVWTIQLVTKLWFHNKLVIFHGPKPVLRTFKKLLHCSLGMRKEKTDTALQIPPAPPPTKVITTVNTTSFFEGVEKLLEVWFTREDGDINCGDLRKIPM